MNRMFSEKGYALVLSGGALRGFAHLGALKAIHERRIPIRMIAGSSAGAIAGFIYASGQFERAYDEISKYSVRDLMSLVDIQNPYKGIIKGNKIIKKIIFLSGKTRLEDLIVPLTVSATNFADGSNRLYSTGQADKVLRASFSIPGIFPVVQYDECSLMDGDLSNSLPVEAVKGGRIICIDVKSSPLNFRNTNAYEAIMKSIELLGNRNLKNRLAIARKKKAIIIQPKMSHIDYVSFSHMKEAIKIGYEDTLKALDKAFPQSQE
jgi:NTE family protein